MTVYISSAAILAPPYPAKKLEKIGDEADMKTKRLPRLDRLAIVAARQALGTTPTDGLALIVGTGFGGLQATVDFLEGMAARGPQFGSPTAFHESVHHAPAGQISILLGITGLSLTSSARELSGETALREGVDLIEAGRAKRALVVCSEEVVPALEAAYRAFGSTIHLAEGAAAVLLTSEKTEVEVSSVEIRAKPTSTLRFTSPPTTADQEQGLIRIARAAERIRAGSRSERIVSFSMGGGEATVELRGP